MTKPDKELDKALTAAEENRDPAIADLVMLADELERELAGDPPSATRDRALFIEGVGARKRSMWSSLTVPAVAVIALLAFLALSGRGAMPGDALYPVREVLHSAGLASAPVDEANKHLDQAALLLAKAEGAYAAGSSQVAARYATTALKVLGQAEEHMRDLPAADRQRFARRIDDMTLRAVTFIQLGDESRPDTDDRDSSGPGSDDSDDDDNSGPGSDDSDDTDNSGSGSDDSDDRSGSDDSDNSGSGSDDSGGDNSGSGSDSSGSGSGDDREDVLDDRRDELEDRRDD